MTATFYRVMTGMVLLAAAGASHAQAPAESQGQMYDGVVRPSKQVVLTAPVSGILAELVVERGDRVDEGTVLLRMDDGLQALVVASAKLQAESDTELKAETLAKEEAAIMYERAAQAFRDKAASEWEVRRAKLQLEQSEAAVFAAGEKRELAQVNLKLEEEKLARYRLKAPFKGIVDSVEVSEGATLGTTDKILTLISLDPLEAEMYLPSSLYGKMRLGQTYALETDQATIGKLEGRLKYISQNFDYASQTFRCVLEIPNPEWKLPAGFMVRLATVPQ